MNKASLKKTLLALFGVLVFGAFVVVVVAFDDDTPEMINIDVSPVRRSDVENLASCIESDSCQVPRFLTTAAGQQLWGVSVTGQQARLQVMYFVAPKDNAIRIVITTQGEQPVLIEDAGLSGVVAKMVEIDGTKPRTFIRGDEGFDERWPAAQHIYRRVMELARLKVIPPPDTKKPPGKVV